MDRCLFSLLVAAGCRADPPTPAVEIPAGARCAVDGDRRACTHSVHELSTGAFGQRRVYAELPLGDAPPTGWPVAVLFQGTGNPAAGFWEAARSNPWGAWHQVGVVEALLDAGFAVLTPDTQGGGLTAWNTNVAPWAIAWEQSPDHRLMLEIGEAIAEGTFGPLDPDARFAGGISSGGYMTSRMAQAYPGEWRALAIQSASWATCGGAFCVIPSELPADHPPTLFLHGARDALVPLSTMERYAGALDDQGVAVRTVVDPELGHVWLPEAPDEIVAWFSAAL